MTRFRRCSSLTFALAILFATHVSAQDTRPGWNAGWASAQMAAEGDNALTLVGETTLRQIVRLSTGGRKIRIRVSNSFGREPLLIGGARVGLAVAPGRSDIEPGSSRSVTFVGRSGVLVPAGADYVSDPIELPVEAGDDLAISLLVPALPTVQTGHPGSRSTSFVVAGDQLDAAVLDEAATVTRWYLLAAVDVEGRAPAVIALFGDSITDGYGVLPDTNQRWSDRLAERVRADPRLADASVINLGIGGNRMLRDGLGPNAMARFERDVVAQAGVTHLVILEGVNDLGVLTRDAPATPEAHARIVQDLTQAYAQLVSRARDRGIVAIGATIMPFSGSAYYHPGPETEADRQAINAWIRTPGNFDEVIDFDALMRDPERPDRLRPDLDSGDGLHPSMTGYRFMGDGVPLALFASQR